MAGFALPAQLPGMHIILLVAAVAVLGQCEILIDYPVFVAGMAIQAIVLALQGIIRLFGVIEFPGQPLRRPVAIVADFPQSAFVNVVLLVAAAALHLGSLELVGYVAIFASEQDM